jgi:hypothetical protein
MYSNKNIKFTMKHNINELFAGDILIWVGILEPNFRLLKRRKVHTIHYNVEPTVIDSGSDEIWTYSLYMYNLYKNLNKKARFIPILYDNTCPPTNYSENNNPMQLTFIGDLALGRREKEKIINSSGIKIHQIFNLWSDDEFNAFIINNTHIYLNITKFATKTLPTVRINKLLSHKCIIISEHTNEVDDALYKDIVFFKDITEIGEFYKSLMTKSKSELETIAETAHQKFISMFQAEHAVHLIQPPVIKNSME